MLRISPFKTRKHKSFQYEPRYFDPAKEELNQRIERIKAESHPSSTADTEARIRHAFEMRKKSRKETGIGFSQLLLIFLLGLSAVVYFYYPDAGVYVLGLLILVYYLLKRKKII